MQSPVPLLFQILPDGLFKPLAAPNRHHYWRLLVMLYQRFFGPDADLPPPAGFEHREFTRAIEAFLEADDPWDDEDGIAPDSAIGVRANLYFDILVNAGWFLEERVGVVQIISMPPAVIRFMGELLGFIERGPVVVGAKMRSIESALQRVLDGPKTAEDLEEAAAQARDLVTSVSAMGLRVREVMRTLSREPTTAAVIRQIFSEYIAKVYMADYAELTGADHPLARRSAVLALAQEIESSERREHLVQWYMLKATGGDRTSAEERFARALRRIHALERMQDFLDRLEDDLRRMNRRMLALIDYRLRAPDHFDRRIERAIAGVLAAPEEAITAPCGPGQLLSGDLLYRPRTPRPPIPRIADQRRALSPEQEAMRRLLRRATEARLVAPHEVQRYLARVLHGRAELAAADLPVESIKDFRIAQTLATLVLQARIRRAHPARPAAADYLAGYRLIPMGETITTEYLEMPDFRIARVAA